MPSHSPTKSNQLHRIFQYTIFFFKNGKKKRLNDFDFIRGTEYPKI